MEETQNKEQAEQPKKYTKTPRLRAKTYAENPFLEEKYPLVKLKTKRITNNRGGYLIKNDTGEIVSDLAGFWTAEEVDSTKFVKLYINGVKAFSDLSTKGTKVFEILYYEIQNNIGKDKIYLNFGTLDLSIKISKTTFYDGLNELVDKKFIAPVENAQHWFWINPDYLWNGDRLSFVKTFLKKKNDSIARDTRTLDLPFGENEIDFPEQ